MIIGAIGIIAGIYPAFTGGEFQDYIWVLFIGITLVGTAYYNNKEWKKERIDEA
jgi:hypothetical protein